MEHPEPPLHRTKGLDSQARILKPAKSPLGLTSPRCRPKNFTFPTKSGALLFMIPRPSDLGGLPPRPALVPPAGPHLGLQEGKGKLCTRGLHGNKGGARSRGRVFGKPQGVSNRERALNSGKVRLQLAEPLAAGRRYFPRRPLPPVHWAALNARQDCSERPLEGAPDLHTGQAQPSRRL